ncbi:HAD-like domain-containing protein [Phaeosphaeria sp. MPI-PUGE-AT-0046c]|nr:HAD-like domain-containing protein [Phaeosphaeria sp. MPI-PUGE-AT-0046c]
MSTVASARYIPHDSPVANPDTNLDKTAIGRRDSASPQISFRHFPAANMNAQAMPFRPGGGSNEPHFRNQNQNYNRNEHIPPPMPPFGHPNAPWNMGFPPPMQGPPPPPPFFAPNHFPVNEYEVRQHAQANEQARMHYQWAQNQYQNAHGNGFGHGQGHPGPHSQFQPPYNQPQMYPQQHHAPHHPHQHQQPPPPPPPRHHGFQHPAHYQAMQQASWPNGATNQELQYAFTTLIEDLQAKKRATNAVNRAPTPSSKKNKKSKAKAKAAGAANGEDLQEYGSLHRINKTQMCSSRINKTHSIPQPAKNGKKKGRHGDEKIMLPAPQPTDLYLNQAAEDPTAIGKPGHILVILDLNGTVLFRPNKNAKTMIARPYLKPFLRYLFQNFKVMVWSSARPVNVKALVEQALDKDLRSKLVATWARDTFGLSATNFNQNVQVYKNLRLIWSRDQIQQHHPEYASGERFGQHNTVLIDDSALKASAQPHNLLEIPEFEATPEQMEGDVLREVAGYLEVLRSQADVSKFVNKQPFQGDGRWNFDWPVDSPGGGDMKDKVSMKGKRPTPSPKPQLLDVTESLSSVSLSAAQRDA